MALQPGEHTLINARDRSGLGITALSDGGSKWSDYSRAAYPLFGKEQKCLAREIRILLYSMLSVNLDYVRIYENN